MANPTYDVHANDAASEALCLRIFGAPVGPVRRRTAAMNTTA